LKATEAHVHATKVNIYKNVCDFCVEQYLFI